VKNIIWENVTLAQNVVSKSLGIWFEPTMLSFTQNASLVWHVIKTCPMISSSWTKIRPSTVQRIGPRKRPTDVLLVKGQLYLLKDKLMLQGSGLLEKITIRIVSNARIAVCCLTLARRVVNAIRTKITFFAWNVTGKNSAATKRAVTTMKTEKKFNLPFLALQSRILEIIRFDFSSNTSLITWKCRLLTLIQVTSYSVHTSG